MKRTCDSFSIIFGVVPEAISAWKPDSAPQAIVMNTNGNSEPANTGPVAVVRRTSVTASFCITGSVTRMPIGEQHDRADLHEGRQVVARGQQHPHRQDGGDEAVGDQAEDERLGLEREGVGEARVLHRRRRATIASSSSVTPIAVASSTRPGRSTRM